MSEESTWEMLYEEPLEPPKMSAEEAFEAGKKGEMPGYDAAARKVARIYFETAISNCMVAKVLGKLLRLRDQKDRWQRRYGLDDDDVHQVWQDCFLHIDDFLSYVMEKEAPEAKEEIRKVGPTMFMHGWAIQKAARALKEEGHLNDYYYPQIGHVEPNEEGYCPRCNNPFQKAEE